MKTGELSQRLGVAPQTIANWINVFSDYFSDGAQALNTRNRSYEENDLIILFTIAKLSHQGMNYDAIRERLKAGERIENLSTVQFGTDTAMIARSTAESWLDAAAIKTELEITQKERDRLITELQQIKDQLSQQQGENKTLLERIAQLQHDLGLAQGELNYRRQLDEKRRDE
jgi:DNA-binding transcriptional MerR regulator